jgi:hypothetical protein
MSEATQALRTKDVLIEICPKCNMLHTYHLTGGVLDGLAKTELSCGTQIGELPAKEGENKSTPVLCDYVIKPREGSDGNIFTIRRWNFRERQEWYTMTSEVAKEVTPGSTAALKVNITPKIMDHAITRSVTKSPFPLKTADDLSNPTVDGAILEALYSEILDWNTPPLARSSTLRQRFIRITQASARTMN